MPAAEKSKSRLEHYYWRRQRLKAGAWDLKITRTNGSTLVQWETRRYIKSAVPLAGVFYRLLYSTSSGKWGSWRARARGSKLAGYPCPVLGNPLKKFLVVTPSSLDSGWFLGFRETGNQWKPLAAEARMLFFLLFCWCQLIVRFRVLL